MPHGSDYFFFREHIKPAWEDTQNLGQLSVNTSQKVDWDLIMLYAVSAPPSDPASGSP